MTKFWVQERETLRGLRMYEKVKGDTCIIFARGGGASERLNERHATWSACLLHMLGPLVPTALVLAPCAHIWL